MSDSPRTRRQRTAVASTDVASPPALVTEAPAVWGPARTTAAPALDGRLGWDSPRPSLEAAAGPIRPLESLGDVLPELEEATETRRPLWRHPASLISMATTLLALIACAVFFFIGGFSGSVAAADLRLEVTDNVVRATWAGPDVPYQVIVVDGPAGAELDVSQGVTGTELWLPRAAALVDDGSCIVVRPAEGNEDAPVSLTRSTLDEQGGVAECVADATAP